MTQLYLILISIYHLEELDHHIIHRHRTLKCDLQDITLKMDLAFL